MVPGANAAVSVRQHEVQLSAEAPSGSVGNAVQGTVVRNVFLGSSRDYIVEAADGTQLRVVTSAEQSVPEGDKVWLYLPPRRCRVLVG